MNARALRSRVRWRPIAVVVAAAFQLLALVGLSYMALTREPSIKFAQTSNYMTARFLGELAEGSHAIQRLHVPHDGLARIDLMGEYTGTRPRTLRMRLRDSARGSDVRVVNLDARLFGFRGMQPFIFDAITDSGGRTYDVIVDSPDGTAGAAPAVFGTECDCLYDSEFLGVVAGSTTAGRAEPTTPDPQGIADMVLGARYISQTQSTFLARLGTLHERLDYYKPSWLSSIAVGVAMLAFMLLYSIFAWHTLRRAVEPLGDAGAVAVLVGTSALVALGPVLYLYGFGAVLALLGG